MKKTDEIDNVINQIAVNKKSEEGERFIIGTFNGNDMEAADGRVYPIPHNYASKSKLVEGDTMKLIITPDGEFIYKQIGSVPRRRFIGRVEIGPDGTYVVYNPDNNKVYEILLASATHFKLYPADEVVLIIPKDKDSKWGAVENVILKSKKYDND